MRYTNSTPFPTLCFESTGPEGRPIHTVVVRATTSIVPGGPLRLSDRQLPLNFTDCYFGKPGASSLKYPTDLVPFKPKTDIIVVGTAYPPNESSRAWNVSVKVGQHRKSLVVTCPLSWKKGVFRWTLSPFRPASKQPLRYEGAFGGAFTHAGAKGEARVLDVYQANPVGKGWVSPLLGRLPGGEKNFPAPHVYSASSDIPPVFGSAYAVEGLGAIAPTWESRRRYVGTWNDPTGEESVTTPSDFNPLFFNSAHPDLIVPYLKGDEKVQLVNLTPGGKLDFQLPGHTVLVVAHRARGGEPETISASLDTLLIEPDEMRAALAWRATLPVEAELEAIEAQFIFNEAAGGEGDES